MDRKEAAETPIGAVLRFVGTRRPNERVTLESFYYDRWRVPVFVVRFPDGHTEDYLPAMFERV